MLNMFDFCPQILLIDGYVSWANTDDSGDTVFESKELSQILDGIELRRGKRYSDDSEFQVVWSDRAVSWYSSSASGQYNRCESSGSGIVSRSVGHYFYLAMGI